MGRQTRNQIIYHKLEVLQLPDDANIEVIGVLLRDIHYNEKGCWVRGDDSTIYTTIKYNNRKISAHRVSYEIFRGLKIPHNMCACHECDVRACINPYHVFPGTHSDNMQDGRIKRRVFSVGPHDLKKININQQKSEMSREQIELSRMGSNFSNFLMSNK